MLSSSWGHTHVANVVLPTQLSPPRAAEANPCRGDYTLAVEAVPMQVTLSDAAEATTMQLI
jgi:hypothetical protein